MCMMFRANTLHQKAFNEGYRPGTSVSYFYSEVLEFSLCYSYKYNVLYPYAVNKRYATNLRYYRCCMRYYCKKSNGLSDLNGRQN